MHTNSSGWCRLGGAAMAIMLGTAAMIGGQARSAEPFIPRLLNTTTVPENGDTNPYGVAFVPSGFPAGLIKSGDVLVSNFNNSAGVQGTGTTITFFGPDSAVAAPGAANTFFKSKLVGLSTALGVLRGGFVVVGNVPTTNGAFPVFQGALQVVDRNGNWVQTLTNDTYLNGPWDLAIDDHGASAHIFVSNVAIGTVSRLDVTVGPKTLTVDKMTTIASGYTVQPNAAAVILGPTGLAFDSLTDTLYVASTGDNQIFAIPNATRATSAVDRGFLIFSNPHLRGPLALRFAPNGDLLTANGDAVNPDPDHPSEIVEFTTSGLFVAEYNVDSSEGGAFGLDTVLETDGSHANFAAVDDVTNNLAVYKLPVFPGN
jgi:hypothetical protein